MPHVLTAKQKRYAELRFYNFNRTEAARRAGYKDNGKSAIRVQAYDLEHNPRVQRLIYNIRRVMLRRLEARVPLSIKQMEALYYWPDCPENLRGTLLINIADYASKNCLTF